MCQGRLLQGLRAFQNIALCPVAHGRFSDAPIPCVVLTSMLRCRPAAAAAASSACLLPALPTVAPTGLDLAVCEMVGDAALAVISAHMRQLATLKVNGCSRVTDAGLAHVCDIDSLLTLHLDRCIHITDAGLKLLTRLSGLTSLRISRCPNITDLGVSQLSKLSRLSTLSLAQCPLVTDVGLMSLAPLTTLASLEF